MTDRRMFPPGTPLSPTGWVVVSACGRRTDRRQRGEARKKRHCWWCGEPCPGRRTDWCSDACSQEMWSRDPSTLRGAINARDRGKPCALCGRERYAPEVDHIVPIIEGGHPWDHDNLRSICGDCHKFETRMLAARRASARRVGASTWQPCERRPENAGRPQCLASLTDGHQACTCDRPPRRARPRQLRIPPPQYPDAPNEHTREFWVSRDRSNAWRAQIRDIVHVLLWWRRRCEHERRLKAAASAPMVGT